MISPLSHQFINLNKNMTYTIQLSSPKTYKLVSREFKQETILNEPKKVQDALIDMMYESEKENEII